MHKYMYVHLYRNIQKCKTMQLYLSLYGSNSKYGHLNTYQNHDCHKQHTEC